MLKPTARGLREPIFLTKLKKRAKGSENIPLGHGEARENIEYDMQVFQESLNVHKVRALQERSEQTEKAEKTEKTFKFWENAGNYRTHSEGMQALSNRQGKLYLNQTVNASTDHSLLERNCLTQNAGYYASTHKANLSLKPITPEIINKQNAILHQPQLANLMARTLRTINSSKADTLKEIKLFSQSEMLENMNNKPQIGLRQDERQQYEKKIVELEQKNQQSEKRIAHLQLRLKQKEQMTLRVEKIEQDLSTLFEENQELLRINESLAKLQPSLHQVQSREAEVQTLCFPVYVQDSFCQTQLPQLQIRNRRLSESQANQDYLNRSKNWKIEFQKQRISFLNKQTENKILTQNIHIQHRQLVDRLQKQLQTLTMKYESKCQQVKDKEGIINRYLFHKA